MKSIIKLIGARFIKRTITRDLTLGLILIITFTLVSFGAISYFVNTVKLQNDLNLQADKTAEKLSNILSIPMWTLDLKTVHNIGEAYKAAENVVGIRILDEAGHEIYASVSQEGYLITARKPIYYQDRSIGLVEISLSTEQIRSLQNSILITTSTIILLVIVAVLFATGLLLEFTLNRPLQALTKGINKVANGNYSYVLAPAPQSDINEIVQRVNKMSRQIAERIEALRHERDIIGRIMQTSPVGITMSNRDGQITFANSQARKILGLEEEDDKSDFYNTLLEPIPNLDEHLFLQERSLFLQVISSGEQVSDLQLSIKLADGKQGLLSINTAPLFNETGLVDGIVTTIDDITERKRSETELRQRLAELESVQRISTVLRTARTMDEMLPRLLDETLTVLGTDTGAIYLFDEQENVLKSVVAKGWFIDIFEETVSLSAGIEGKTFSTGTSYLSAELAHDPLTNETTRSKIPSGWGGMCIPIRSADEILGVLWIAMVQPRKLQPENLHLLITLSEIAGNAFHRTRLHAQTEQRLRRLTALRTLDMAISVNVDLNKTINILLDQAITHLGVDAADVLLFHPDLNSLEYVAGRGFRSDSFASTSLQLGQGLAGRAVFERKIVKFQDWREEPELGDLPSLTASFETENFISYYGLPLIVKEQVKGVMEVFHRSPLKADPEWLDFLATLAGQVAMAIDDAQLFSSLQRSNSELAQAYTTTLEGWSRALDLKDKETEGHTQRVAAMTIQLAQILGISEEEIVHIRRGALLHDIGKMGIPDDILLKPGALSEEEWLIMRKHPTYAYEMLAPIEYLRLSLDIPYCHHEKWDGTGYPQGLKGENIPLAARLFAVVDVWDALISDRPYRSAWSREKALAYIAAQSGKYFDPQVVEAFLKIP